MRRDAGGVGSGEGSFSGSVWGFVLEEEVELDACAVVEDKLVASADEARDRVVSWRGGDGVGVKVANGMLEGAASGDGELEHEAGDIGVAEEWAVVIRLGGGLCGVDTGAEEGLVGRILMGAHAVL